MQDLEKRKLEAEIANINADTQVKRIAAKRGEADIQKMRFDKILEIFKYLATLATAMIAVISFFKYGK